uniref:Uncharacterized protein n=1 Tax=Eutreptiella gymnastica TaxID=73025 RepID=A0A7S4GCT2_9EUGL
MQEMQPDAKEQPRNTDAATNHAKHQGTEHCGGSMGGMPHSQNYSRLVAWCKSLRSVQGALTSANAPLQMQIPLKMAVPTAVVCKHTDGGKCAHGTNVLRNAGWKV